eukprot:m.19611 g.19611  ORF g.19611 m.19611 type:complete len:719 (+) comp5139_c0_seq1:97-2253(+)
MGVGEDPPALVSFGRVFGDSKYDFSRLKSILKLAILILCCILAFSSRLFAVVRFESVIHEFDPYFNYRTTRYLVEEGLSDFQNWFDDRAWYPLGRIVGGTIYPGLMVTSSIIHKMLHFVHVNINIREICVFLAPLFSAFTTLATYSLTAELRGEKAGLVAALMIAIVPGYISRSVAGSYDNEGIAIFCMILTYYFWIKAIKSGSLFWAAATALAYFYMVSSWGGYVFLINLIPLHVLVLMIMGRFDQKTYVVYSVFYALGTFLSMQIAFVGFQPIQTSEHMGALGIFGLCQIYAFVSWLRSRVTSKSFAVLVRFFLLIVLAVAGVCLSVALFQGKIAPWSGRFYSMLDPTFAKKHIPIIASVSEHQPTTWSSYYFDLQFLVFLFPLGLYFCFKKLTNESIFIILYGITAMYFSGVMVRLMLTLSPVMCVLGGVAVSGLLELFLPNLEGMSREEKKKKMKRSNDDYPYKSELGTLVVGGIAFMLMVFCFHSTWVTQSAYSSPSIVLVSKPRSSGSKVIFDDFREAYYWLRMNTPQDAKVMSWWDYGYQISSIADRTVIVDNNTWNNTHISRVGQAMASDEDHAYEIMKELDVDYVLVLFGGYAGYASDDINKFLWMVRIGGSTPLGAHITEKDYFSESGEFKIDASAPKALLNSLMYKMSYYNFHEAFTQHGKPGGWDRVRKAEMGNKDFKLKVIEEAFTSEHWLVRIYRVKDKPNRDE